LRFSRFVTVNALIAAMCIASSLTVCAQAAAELDPAEQDQHEHMRMAMAPSGWQFMEDGLLRLTFNHQDSPRGGHELVAPNWWMGMASRTVGSSQLTFTSMFSLDPVTVGKSGYREILQAGEALDGRPLIDRQHPHDLFMQLAAIWRTPMGHATSFTIAGGPVGEPALGPVAFMHRASAANLPFAPLSHHTFDSTHIAFGVVTAAIDRGPLTIEASLFNGREPDENRWDFDFGRLDSVSVRAWYRPTDEWELQASTGHLVDAEQLEPGNIQRSTASATWMRQGDNFTAVTFGYGINALDATHRQAAFAEATRHRKALSLSARVEVLQVETAVLRGGGVPASPAQEELKDTVAALTLGASREITRWHGFEGSIGAAATANAVPAALRETYGPHPFSFQLFFTLRPPAGAMGRMWNMRMSQPTVGHTMTMPME
jgi:hypothetical protein